MPVWPRRRNHTVKTSGTRTGSVVHAGKSPMKEAFAPLEFESLVAELEKAGLPGKLHGLAIERESAKLRGTYRITRPTALVCSSE